MAPMTRRMRARTAASADRLPRDMLFEALLHLPARDLCRLRAVCRSWCNVISDRLFTAAHLAVHGGRPPLFIAKFRNDRADIHLVDLSGQVIKRFAGIGGRVYQQLLPTRLDIACVARELNMCTVINPATADYQFIPRMNAPESSSRLSEIMNPVSTFFTLGRVPATGEHKFIRMFNGINFRNGRNMQVFEVLTVSGGGNIGDVALRQWRAVQSPGLFIEECSGTVVDGMAYFMTSSLYEGRQCGIRADYIVSFDLGKEEWMRDIRGPISSNAGEFEPRLDRNQLALAEINGYLVLSDQNRQPFTMDLWYLVDFQSALWAKQYHIQTRPLVEMFAGHDYHVQPLLGLEDGRLVVFVAGRLFIYDPATKSFETVNIGLLDSVAVYTGNLLSLE